MAYRISNGYVDVSEDNYEKGCSFDIFTEEFPSNLYRKTFETQEELRALVAKGFYMDKENVTIRVYQEGEAVQFLVSTFVDDDRLPPSEHQLEQWKRGEIKLYAMDVYFNVEKVTPLTKGDLKQLFQ